VRRVRAGVVNAFYRASYVKRAGSKKNGKKLKKTMKYSSDKGLREFGEGWVVGGVGRG